MATIPGRHCEAKLFGRQCGQPAEVEVGGATYCFTHDPSKGLSKPYQPEPVKPGTQPNRA